jgi:hypothetical protein
MTYDMFVIVINLLIAYGAGLLVVGAILVKIAARDYRQWQKDCETDDNHQQNGDNPS